MRNTVKTANFTQTQAVADHFKNVGSISGLEALSLYQIVSLTKVMSVLRQKGMQIVGSWRKDNVGRRYKRYFIAQSI
jgi:hypothetical protein